MKISRRNFIKGTGLAGAAGLVTKDVRSEIGAEREGCTVTTTICPFCAVGCGALVFAKEGGVAHVAGDPDHPINEGSLCSKGKALLQVANNERRLTKVRYRAPGAADWEDKDWDWAVQRIARNIKASRDRTFKARDGKGRQVNRAEGIACMGGAALDNEECYAYSKFARSLGVVYLEHQARI
jgi:formate dehydrogenase major subunit